MEAGHVFNDSDETASHLWGPPAPGPPARATRCGKQVRAEGPEEAAQLAPL